MKSIRVNYKLPLWMKEQVKIRKARVGGNESKYIRDALLRQFEWEDRNKKEIEPGGIFDIYKNIVIKPNN